MDIQRGGETRRAPHVDRIEDVGIGQCRYAPGLLLELMERAMPVHELVPVGLYLPGFPPSADRIRAVLEPLLRGQRPQLRGPEQLRFG